MGIEGFFIIGGVLLIATAYLVIRETGTSSKNKIASKYNPNTGIVRNVYQNKASKKRAEVLDNLYAEHEKERQLKVAVDQYDKRIKRTKEAEKLAHQNMRQAHHAQQLEHQNKETVVKRATALNMDVTVYNDIQRQAGINHLDTKKQATLNALEVKKKKETDELDISRRWKEIEQDLKAGFIYAQKEYQYLQMFREYINGLYEERERIKLSGGAGREDKLKLLNSHLKNMEQDFNEQQKRLLQASTRKQLSASNEDTQSW